MAGSLPHVSNDKQDTLAVGVAHPGEGGWVDTAAPQQKKQRLVLALPMYQTLPVPWFFQFTQLKKTTMVGQVATQGIYLPVAMQSLVDMAFDHCGTNWDRLVILEHDMVVPTNGFDLMANHGPEYDIVGSVYFKHTPPHHAMAWGQVRPPFFSPLTAEVVAQMVDYPRLYEVHGVAMGFTSIARHVFEQWDKSVPMWEPTPPLVGHDLHFCNEARKQGFKIWLDSGIGCGHLTEVEVGLQHNQRYLDDDDIDERPSWMGADTAGFRWDPITGSYLPR